MEGVRWVWSLAGYGFAPPSVLQFAQGRDVDGSPRRCASRQHTAIRGPCRPGASRDQPSRCHSDQLPEMVCPILFIGTPPPRFCPPMTCPWQRAGWYPYGSVSVFVCSHTHTHRVVLVIDVGVGVPGPPNLLLWTVPHRLGPVAREDPALGDEGPLWTRRLVYSAQDHDCSVVRGSLAALSAAEGRQGGRWRATVVFAAACCHTSALNLRWGPSLEGACQWADTPGPCELHSPPPPHLPRGWPLPKPEGVCNTEVGCAWTFHCG